MKFLKYIFFILTFSFFGLVAEENAPSSQEVSVDTLKPTIDQQNLLIHGCVNVITGHFIDHENDVELPGSRTMNLGRSYSSGNEQSAILGTGWSFDPFSQVELYRVGEGKIFHAFAPKNQIVYHMQGGGTVITGKEAVKAGTKHYSLSHDNDSYLGWCHTDLYSGGKTHRKNLKYSIQDDFQIFNGVKDIHITDGSGKVSRFKTTGLFDYEKHDRRTSNEKIVLPILRVDFPNGHYDKFSKEINDDEKATPFYTSIGFYGADSDCYGNFNFDQETPENLTVKASNGRSVAYQFSKGEPRYLSSVQAFGPAETSPYYTCFYRYRSHQKNDVGKVCAKFEPLGRFLKIGYYESSDKRNGKVKYLGSPEGLLYQFDYEVKSKDHAKHLEGETTVTDVLGRISTYLYKQNRLERVNLFMGKYIYSSILLNWTEDDSITPGLLTKKQIFDYQNRKVVLTQTYGYDSRGNLYHETMRGNLTGKREGSDSKIYTWIDNGKAKNLLHTVEHAGQKTTINYLPDSDLVEAVYIKGDSFQKRQFYFHDKNHLIVKKIQDDGTALGIEDYTGVTHRKIVENTLKDGLPIVIVEKYWNPETSQAEPSQKSEISYNHDGKPLIKKVYAFDKEWIFDQEWQWQYDSAGRCVKEVDAEGHIKTFTYDQLGNLIKEKSGNHVKKHFYDKLNRLIKTAYGKNLSESWEYDRLGNKLSHTDIYHNKTTYGYDDLNRLILLQDPQGGVEEYTYDVLGNKTSIKDKNGYVTHFTHTARGAVSSTTYPDGSVETRTYTPDGHLEEEQCPDGLTVHYKYDAFGRVIDKEWQHLGESQKKQTHRYNAYFLLATTEGDSTTTFHYNHKGQLIEEREGEKLTTYSYDGLGNRSVTRSYATPASFVEEHQKYDRLGRIIYSYQTDETGQIIHEKHQTFNAKGEVTSVTQGDAITLFTYDLFDNLATTIDPNQNKTKVTEDYQHHTLTTTYANGVQLIQTKDSMGQLIEQKQYDPMGKLLQKQGFTYDAKGNKIQENLSVLSDGKRLREIINTFAYDSQDRLTSQVEAVGASEEKTTHFTYDAMGRKIKHIKPGATIHFVYDPLGRLIKKAGPDIKYTYTYDKMGYLIALKNELTGKTTKRSYDLYGNVIKETLESGLTLQRTFDLLNRPTRITLPDGSKIKYCYEGSKLKTVEREGKYSHHYNYDNQGKLISEELPQKGGTISYRYEATSRWMATEHAHLMQEGMGYDPVYNLLGINVKGGPLDEEVHYDYDYLNQLIEESGSQPHTYKNDSLYNRIHKDQVDYDNNSLNQLTSQSDTDYNYDTNGNLVSIVTKKKTQNFTYDALDRLIAVEEAGKKILYEYDGFNRRLSKVTQNKEELYLYDGKREIGSFEKGKQKILRVLGHGIGSSDIHATLAIEKESKIYIPLHHPFGHLAQLLDAETGNPVQHMRTTAFGECKLYQEDGAELPLAKSLSPWLVSSKRYDPETGFTLYGLRYYSPAIGRWITPDPSGFADGPNLYAYARNNPLMYVDLYGLSIWKGVKKGALAAAPFVAIRVVIWGATFACPPIGGTLNAAYTCYNVYSGASLAVQGGGYLVNSINNAATTAEGLSNIGADISLLASNMSVESASEIATSFWINKKVATLGVKSAPTLLATADKTSKAAKGIFESSRAAETIKPFTKYNYRENLKALTGLNPPSNIHAHHVFPQSLEKDFFKQGLTIHNPKYLTWWEGSSHLKNVSAYNMKWIKFLDQNPTMDQILQQGKVIMSEYGIETNY